ncbi:MAG: phytanoyl-CoA dioxygenase family protein [Gammaproteobacteria bacterium]
MPVSRHTGTAMVDPDEIATRFHEQGFVVLPALASREQVAELNRAVDEHLAPPLAPLEYEAELGYPGAPMSLDAEGGGTPRRLLNAYSRDPVFRRWARSDELLVPVRTLLGGGDIALVQAHHNCIMTKYPDHGSETGWHQDTRYWSYPRGDLINAWLALGDEGPENGGMRVIPASHRREFGRERFDEDVFFLPDHPDNGPVLADEVAVTLRPGDVLLFHARLLHAAGRNRAAAVKRSLVFTYRRADEAPLPDSRSSRTRDVPLPAVHGASAL